MRSTRFYRSLAVLYGLNDGFKPNNVQRTFKNLEKWQKVAISQGFFAIANFITMSIKTFSLPLHKMQILNKNFINNALAFSFIYIFAI